MTRAVIRDDGERYSSITKAAQALMSEQVIPPNPRYARQMSSNISAACRGIHSLKSAYGHNWRYADERPREEIVRENEELKRKVVVLECRLEALMTSR